MRFELERFDLDYDAVGELLRGQETLDCLERVARTNAPSSYTLSGMIGANRANVRITAASEEAAQDNNENNTLQKIIHRKVSM